MKNSNLILEIIEDSNNNSNNRNDLINIMKWLDTEIGSIKKSINFKFKLLNKRIKDLEDSLKTNNNNNKNNNNNSSSTIVKQFEQKIPLSPVIVFDKKKNYFSLSGDTYFLKNIIRQYEGHWSSKDRFWIFHTDKLFEKFKAEIKLKYPSIKLLFNY
jgi:hypothetical protein